MADLFNIFHNYLHADDTDSLPEIQQDLTSSDCFSLAVVKGMADQNTFKVINYQYYPVYDSEFILLQTQSQHSKERLCSTLEIDPNSVVSFFQKPADQYTLCYLLIQSNLDDHSENQKIFYYHDRMLSEASKSIIKAIDRNLFEFQTREQAEFYVQKVELAINNYIILIKSHFSENPEEMNIFSNELRKDLLKLYFRYLEIIQSHLEITYTVYRDQNKPVTGKTITLLAAELLQRQSSIRFHLQENGVNETLSAIILHPLRLISDKGECKEVSQQRLNYLIRYGEELHQFFENFDQVKEHQIIQYLYVLNFNNIALLSYICDRYRKLKTEITDEKSLINYLQDRINELNHLPQSILEPYNPDLKDLKKQVRTWIEEEIAHLRESIKQKEKEQEKQTNSQKLGFNHSVDVITAFFRLLHDTGVTGSGANHTVRWINQNISSKNQPHISQQSIQRKFFDKYTNKEPLKNIVIHLLNYLNKT